MAKPENIKIPLALFKRIIYLLECWDLEGYDDVVVSDFQDVMLALQKKKQTIELRVDYAKIVNALDEDSRDLARMSYLQHKREIHDDFF